MDILDSLPAAHFTPGEEIIHEGEALQRLLFLRSGRVEVLREGVRVALIKTPGSVLGELAALLRQPATATVRALDAAKLSVAEDPIGFLEAHPEVCLHVARLLAHRLDAATQYLVDVKEQLRGCSDHVGMVDNVLESIVHRDLKKRASL